LNKKNVKKRKIIYPVISLIITLFPAIWLAVFVDGNFFNLRNIYGNYTERGLFLTIFVFVLALIVGVINTIKITHNNEEAKEKEKELRRKIKDSKSIINEKDNDIENFKNIATNCFYTIARTSAICEEKRKLFTRHLFECQKILEEQGDITKNHFEAINPNAQIRCILNELVNCISKATEVNPNLFVVTLACKYPNENWKWISDFNHKGSKKLEELLNLNSAIKAAINNRDKEYIFYNNKQDGVKKQEYIYHARDNNGKTPGSIVAHYFTVKDNENLFVESVISVSTYGSKFDNSGRRHKETEVMITDLIELFENLLKIELALLCMKEKY